MKEQLIKDFLDFGSRRIYGSDGSIEDITTAGDVVIYTERSECGHYADQHMIPLLEIMAWVYWKQPSPCTCGPDV